MAKYEKVTLSVFKKKLSDGVYVSLTGAKRAIGKATKMSASDRKVATAAAERKFGSKKPAAKKAAKKA